MSSNLDGKVCIVSGGANGLGAAMAKGLVGAGARVVIADLDKTGLDKVMAETRALHGAGCMAACPSDITNERDIDQIVACALDQFQRVDVVINNAGTGAQIVRSDFISKRLNSWDIPPEKWRRIMDVNAIGPFMLSRAAIPHMLKNSWGRIINVSTTWETMLRPGFASYGPSKAALESMSAGMAKELEGTGVTVNTIVPGGPVDTAQVPADIGVPRESLLRPEVMVPAIVWIAGEASSEVTGTRFTAAYWSNEASLDENLHKATEPVAWPQLVKKIVMAERGNLS